MEDDLGTDPTVRRSQRRVAAEPEVDNCPEADLAFSRQQAEGGVVVGPTGQVLDVDVADVRSVRGSGDPREPMDEAQAAVFDDPP